MFVCTPGINVPLEVLCDGQANCFNGDDETTPLCESESCRYFVHIVYCTVMQYGIIHYEISLV